MMSYLDDIRISQPGAQPKTVRPPNYRAARRGTGGKTPSQDAVASFIAKQMEAGHIPSIEAIRAHMGWKAKSSVKGCLETMAAAGRLPEGFEFKVRVW